MPRTQKVFRSGSCTALGIALSVAQPGRSMVLLLVPCQRRTQAVNIEWHKCSFQSLLQPPLSLVWSESVSEDSSFTAAWRSVTLPSITSRKLPAQLRTPTICPLVKFGALCLGRMMSPIPLNHPKPIPHYYVKLTGCVEVDNKIHKPLTRFWGPHSRRLAFSKPPLGFLNPRLDRWKITFLSLSQQR